MATKAAGRPADIFDKLDKLDRSVYPPFGGFPKEGIRFLSGLKKNNNRDWFQKHKSEYEEYVKFPMETLLAALREPMHSLAPEIVVNPKKNIFRIFRDTRFSKDKTPYKTHVAATMGMPGPWHAGAGFYVHIEPGMVYAGGGMYMPDGAQLKEIRNAIARSPKEFVPAVTSPSFRKAYGNLQGEKLVRNPQGFDPADPMIEYLKFKNFYGLAEWDENVVRGAEFVPKLISAFKAALPLVRFLNSALNRGGKSTKGL